MPIIAVVAEPIDGRIHPDLAIVSSLGEHVVGQYVLVRVTDDGRPRRPRRGQRHQRLERRDAGRRHRPDPRGAGAARRRRRPVRRGVDRAAAWTAPPSATASPRRPSRWRLLDLQGQILGVPRLQAARRPRRPRRRRPGIRLKFVVGAVEPDLAAERARRMVERGWKAIKVKVGRDEHPRADVERLRAVREAIGPDVLLSVDANGGYTVEQAVWAARRLREAGRGPVRAADAARRPRGDGRGAAAQRHPDHGRRERLHAAGRPGGDPRPGPPTC